MLDPCIPIMGTEQCIPLPYTKAPRQKDGKVWKYLRNDGYVAADVIINITKPNYASVILLRSVLIFMGMFIAFFIYEAGIIPSMIPRPYYIFFTLFIIVDIITLFQFQGSKLTLFTLNIYYGVIYIFLFLIMLIIIDDTVPSVVIFTFAAILVYSILVTLVSISIVRLITAANRRKRAQLGETMKNTFVL